MKRTWVTMAVAALALVGACGGGKSDNGKDAAAKSTGTTAAGAAASTTLDTTFSGKGSGDFCALVKKYNDDQQKSSTATDPASVKATFADVTKALDDATDAAPKEIKSDVSTLRDYFRTFNSYLAKYGYDYTKVPTNDANSPVKETPEVKTASDRVDAYVRNVCHIDTGTTADDSSSTTEPAGASDANAADETTTTAP